MSAERAAGAGPRAVPSDGRHGAESVSGTGGPLSPLHSWIEIWPPVGAEPIVSFAVDGEPKGAGSKMSGVVTRFDPALGKRVPVERPGGGFKTFTKDSSGEAGTNWRADIRSACADALDVAHELADGPLAVRVTFFTDSPMSRFGSGRNAGALKPTAPARPHRSKLPDGDKLTRALADALTKLVWVDDRRVCECWWSREFGKPGAVVDIFALPETVADAARLGGEVGYHQEHGRNSIEASGQEALAV